MSENCTSGARAKQRLGQVTQSGLAFLILLLCSFPSSAQSGAGQSNTPRQSADVSLSRWLVAGPIPASGDNALFVDYLGERGGESQARAREGEVAAGVMKWQPSDSNVQDGAINFKKLWPSGGRFVAYAYAELSSNRERDVAATVGSGNNIQVRLNGEIIYESRLSRKLEADLDTLVLHLRRGINPLLVKIEADPNVWALQWRMDLSPKRVFVNQHATVIPDFRVSTTTGAWGQVEVANTSGAKLHGVTVEVLGNELVLPSESEKFDLEAGEVRRIPFWVAAGQADVKAAAQPLHLRIKSGAEEQVVEFTPHIRKADEYFVTTYRSAVDGSVQPYSVLLPTSYDQARVYPLIMLLHGAHVTDWGQNIVSYDAKEWAIQVAVHDRGNNRYRDIGQVDLDEVMLDVKHRYRIDEDRIYLSGHSMGGYGTWFQATRRPDLWASVSPQAGYADYALYYPLMRDSGAATQRRFQEQLLRDWSPLTFAENLLYVPAYIVHGAKDDNVSVEHSRRMAARLGELRYDYVYDENPEGRHWWGPRGKYYGTEVVDKPPIWTFFQKHPRRATSPRHVIYSTDTLRYSKAYWVQIDELETANQLARIEAEISAPNAIALHLANIRQLTLQLGAGLVDREQPLSVSVGNQTLFHGRLPLTGRLTLRREDDGRYRQLLDGADLHINDKGDANGFGRLALELDKSGQAVRTSPFSEAPLRKSAELDGPVIDAFNTPFLFVTGTTGRDAKSLELQEAAGRAAQVLAREWMARANGIAEIKRDAELTPEDINSLNLILFGNAQTNQLIARINDALPIKFASSGIIVGNQLVKADDSGLVMILPNPLNTKRYVVIVGGTTPASFLTASRLRLTDLPDYVVFDRRTLVGPNVNFVGGGFFDKFWQLKGSS